MTSPAPWVSELAMEAVIGHMPVAVMVLEASSLRIVELNDAARALTEQALGHTEGEQLEGHRELFRPGARPYVMAQWPLMRSLTSGEEVSEEYIHACADGTWIIVRSSSAPIYDERGEIVAGVLVMEDITRRAARRTTRDSQRAGSRHHGARAGQARQLLAGELVSASGD
jgi:PAS domain S-box-containing protein